MKYTPTLIIIVLLSVALAGCQGTETTLSTLPESDQMELDRISGSNSQIQETVEMKENVVDVQVKNFAYSPKTITAKAGETLKVKLTNVEGTHDFVIDELSVQSRLLNSGESEEFEIQIPADAAGKTYEYYCSVGNHRQMGMVGKLIID